MKNVIKGSIFKAFSTLMANEDIDLKLDISFIDFYSLEENMLSNYFEINFHG